MTDYPALRYFGGKWIVAPWIIEHFPAHRLYVEPYGGGASVLLRKQRSRVEVYNDLDATVVSFFRVLRDPELAARLREMLRLTPYARDEWLACMDAPPNGDPVEMARRLLVRSYQTIGGDRRTRNGFRTNIRRTGSHPAVTWANIPDRIDALTERMRGVAIENAPAIDVIQGHDTSETLFYVDPPYVMETRHGRTRYPHEMDDNDHRELAQVLHAVSGFVVISGYASPLYDELYAGWHTADKPTPKPLYPNGGGGNATERLWLSPRTHAALHRQLSFLETHS